jgi:hypothetical protein
MMIEKDVKMAKFTYVEIANELRDTSKISLETKGSYSYVTGLYESILAGLVADLPQHRQAEVMRSLRLAQSRMQENT